MKIKVMIKTFEEACKKLGINSEIMPDVSMYQQEHRKHIIAEYKLLIIVKVLNEDWIPDWSNDSEYKYFPYFYWDKKSGFSFYNVFYFNANTDAASSLCFFSEKTAKYCATQFLEIWKDYIEIDDSNKHARAMMMEIEKSL